MVAAIAERYYKQDLKRVDVLGLKNYFADLEAHFHGSSSGFDPLVSYLNCPILVGENRELVTARIPEYNEGKGCLFLLNTGRARRTEPLVNLFLEKCKLESFDHLCRDQLTVYTNRCIHAFLQKDVGTLLENFQHLSDFQYHHMRPMIPKLFQDLWSRGLEKGHYSLKLCGAGGGGFLLGMTENLETIKSELANHEIRPLFRF